MTVAGSRTPSSPAAALATRGVHECDFGVTKRCQLRGTARHGPRWTGGYAYRSPLEVREDEVPADLLTRLAAQSPQNPRTAAKA